MKKILLLAAAAVVAALALADNDSEAKQQQALASMYDHVLQHNADTAVQNCQSWRTQISQTQAGTRTAAIDAGFKTLLQSWKAVEATYIAGDLDVAAIDYPRYIDIFHMGNEDIAQQMQKVLESRAAPSTALFKHSYKTINALEAVLYEDDKLDTRELAIADAISQNICQRLADIQHTYTHERSAFLAKPDKALSMLVNALANQTFSLKDWRIGDAAGLSKRYEGKPDPRRAEYVKSDLSMSAVEAILAAQAQLINPQPYPNFVHIADIYAAQKPLQQSQALLQAAQQEAQRLNRPRFDFNSQDSRTLFQTTAKLQTSYYVNLIHALPVVAKILEADGD